MADRVKGITVEIGGDVTGLNKALKGTNDQIRTTQSQLKDVEKLLKLDPKNTVLLEQKQRLLADAIGETESKLDTLKAANDQVAGSVKNYDAWKKAYDPIQEEIKETNEKLKELKDQRQELNDSGKMNTDEFKELQAEIDKTTAELKNLKSEAKKVSEEFGNPISQSQYDALQREIIDTQQELDKLEDRARDAQSALEKVDEQPIDDVKTAANKAGDALEDAGKEASNFGDYLKAGVIVEGVKAITGAISDLSEETQEYRKIMGTLETSSEQAGYTAEQTKETYQQLYGVLGDEQKAATAVANLQALQLPQEMLTELVNSGIGAWAKYGDSIPIDGLAEAYNESVRTGKVTGALADVLNWGSKENETFGVKMKENIEFTKLSEKQLASLTETQRAQYEATKKQYEEIEAWNKAVEEAEKPEDFFNLALEDKESEWERANFLLQTLSDQGLTSAADAWRKNNEDIVAANEAQSDFMEKAAQLSERVAPAIQAVKEGGNDLLQMFLDLTSEVDFDAIAETINQVFAAVESLITFLVDNQEIVLTVITAIGAGLAALKLADLFDKISEGKTLIEGLSNAIPLLGNAISVLTNPIFLVTAAVVAVVALIATKGDEIQALLQKLDDWLQSVFLTDWTKVFGPGLGDALNGFFAGLKNIWDSVKLILDGVIDFIRGIFTGDWERAWEGVRQILEGIFNGLQAVVKAPLNAIIGAVNSVISHINTLIAGLNNIGFDLPSWLGGGSFRFNIPSIPNIPYLAKGGIVGEGSAIVGEAGPELLTVSNGRTMVQPLPGNTGKIESLLGSIDSRIGGQGEIQIVVPVTLDGREIGEASYRYIQNRGRVNG